MQAYDRITRYKGAMMGFAIFIVLYGHLLYYHSGLQNYQDLNITLWYTVGSIDMFMFLSGFGIYHSLKKDADPLRFMQRRISRLLPAWAPFILVYCGFMLLTDQMNKWQFLGNLTTFGWWTRIGGQFNWYVPTLLAAYLLSPLLFAIIERYGKRSVLVFPVLFLLDAACVDTSLMIGVSRFPVYFLGMYMASDAAKGHQPSKRHRIIAYALFVVSMIVFYFLVVYFPDGLSKYGLWWHPFLPATPGFLYLITGLFEKMEKWKPTERLNRFLEFAGGKSFEIYLCHLLVYTVALTFGLRGWLPWICMVAVGFLTGVGYSILVDRFVKWKSARS